MAARQELDEEEREAAKAAATAKRVAAEAAEKVNDTDFPKNRTLCPNDRNVLYIRVRDQIEDYECRVCGHRFTKAQADKFVKVDSRYVGPGHATGEGSNF